MIQKSMVEITRMFYRKQSVKENKCVNDAERRASNDPENSE